MKMENQPAKGESKLGFGGCPACGAKNSSADRFCHNPDCGEVLIAPCLACKRSVSHFLKACGFCGGVQEQIRAERTSAIRSRLEKARLELESHRYTMAIELSKEIVEEAKPFSHALRKEAVCLLNEAEEKQGDMKNFAVLTLDSALAHERKYAYSAALRELDKLPNSVQGNDFFFESENADLVRKRIRGTQKNIAKLESELEQAISQGDTTRILGTIALILKLQPFRNDLLERKRSIEKQKHRRERQTVELLKSVRSLFAAQDYQGVLSSIQSAAPYLISNEIISITEESKQNIKELEILWVEIENALSEENDLNALTAINRILSLKSDNKKAIKIKQELSKKLENQQKQQQAIDSARRRKRVLVTSLCLAVTCIIIAISLQQYFVSRQLREAWLAKDYARVLAIEPDNKEALLEVALEKNEFKTALELDPTNPRALLLEKQHELNSLLADGNYEAALKMDPQNATAKQLKKDAEFQAAISTRDYKKALLIDPSNASAQSLKKSAEIRKLISEGYLKPVLDIGESADVIQSHFIASKPRRNSIGMFFKAIPSGMFRLGSSYGDSDENRAADWLQHMEPFEIGVHEVSQLHYRQVMGTNPSLPSQDKLPVNQVSWQDAMEFCRRLSALPEEQEAGNSYRLPTETEWEYACKAGSDFQLNLAIDVGQQLEKDAWHRGNSDGSIHPVGQKLANAWGVHDMKGNVWEWCSKEYSTEDNLGLRPGRFSRAQETLKVIKGGSFQCFPELCRAANRSRKKMTDKRDDIGFRVICTRL